MNKKNFTRAGGLDSLLGAQAEKPKRGRPVTQTKEVTKSTQQGNHEGETRATFIIKEELLKKLKAIAYWERLLIKDVVNTAIQGYIDKINPKPRPEEIRLKDQAANQKLIKQPGVMARMPKY